MKTRMNEKTTDVKVLRDAMLFSLSIHKWGNRTVIDRKDKKEMIKEGVNQDVLHVTKRLLESSKLEALHRALDEAHAWCTARSMMSTIRKGVYLVKRSMIEAFEAKLTEINSDVQSTKLPEFFAEFEACKKKAKERLGSLYDESDYPTQTELRSTYYVEWNWFGLSVPDNLPKEVRERECKKLKETYEKAMIEVRYALREGLQKLTAHAVERLTVEPGKEPKVFRDKSMLNNFKEFFDTFSARDLTSDKELEAAMNQVRKVIDKFDADAVRENVDIRNEVATQFDKVNKQLDALLVDRPVRKFAFDE